MAGLNVYAIVGIVGISLTLLCWILLRCCCYRGQLVRYENQQRIVQNGVNTSQRNPVPIAVSSLVPFPSLNALNRNRLISFSPPVPPSYSEGSAPPPRYDSTDDLRPPRTEVYSGSSDSEPPSYDSIFRY